MTLEKLQKDMIAAMKAHEKDRKEAISSLIGAVKKYAIDNGIKIIIPDNSLRERNRGRCS